MTCTHDVNRSGVCRVCRERFCIICGDPIKGHPKFAVRQMDPSEVRRIQATPGPFDPPPSDSSPSAIVQPERPATFGPEGAARP